MLTLAAAILLSTTDVANALRNLAQLHQLSQAIELRRDAGLEAPADLPPDPWGTPYRIQGNRIVSAGSDRQFEVAPAAGQFDGTEGDIVFESGLLVRSNRNWLNARVQAGTDAAVALDELRQAELRAMFMHMPTFRNLMLARLTAEAMARGGANFDAWGTPLRVDGTRAISAGADKQFDPMSWGRPATNNLGEDIIVENGQVTRAVDAEALLRETSPYVDPIPQPVDAPIKYPESYRRVGGDVTAPKVVKRVEPQYPEDYRKARISGIVIVEAMISEQGAVENVRLLKSRAPELDAAAMDAVKQWTFEPATSDGKPVPVIFNLTVNFKLQ